MIPSSLETSRAQSKSSEGALIAGRAVEIVDANFFELAQCGARTSPA